MKFEQLKKQAMGRFEAPRLWQRDANLWSRLVLRYVSEGILAVDAEGYCTYASPKACTLLGRDSRQLLGRELHSMLHERGVHKEPCSVESCAILRQQQSQRAQSKVDDHFDCAGGRRLPVDYVIDPIRHGERYLGAVLVFNDATERLAIQAMRAEEERKLVEYSQNMEEFTYQFAHDIKEPLRTLNYSCDFLREELSQEQCELVAEILDSMTDSVSRLQRMIEDSLAYAVARSEELDLVPVSLDKCVQTVVRGLELKISECNGCITVGELPQVIADRSQMERVFQNLFQNALKFRSSQPPEIHVYALPGDDPGIVEVAVRDNGIGIEKEHQSRIFGTFQRLHSHQKYEGSGIGLAFVRKSLERQGGSVRVESEPGKGATFILRMKAA